ncbi:hypothetical protein F9C07_10754 [Aspergillus flavus]|uniref:Uncharacterized protein n=1 Tax=Aspergillus flavus (strain ATCC 200026 / FGSC A1120 / IAM 13836 / NRRL 3357 / JCM 12722 / SRRC 167) TaxID=332952 RepID=A0A7U2MV24_ASPFN|nr:hypothetical protein F9C07_10754 [Aspergillus flavus]
MLRTHRSRTEVRDRAKTFFGTNFTSVQDPKDPFTPTPQMSVDPRWDPLIPLSGHG